MLHEQHWVDQNIRYLYQEQLLYIHMLVFQHLLCIHLLSKAEEARMDLFSYMLLLTMTVNMLQEKIDVIQPLQMLKKVQHKQIKSGH